MHNKHNIRFAFFGTAPLAEEVLSELEKVGMLPSVVIAGRDVPERRGKGVLPPVEKQWALSRTIPVLQPEKIDADFLVQLSKAQCELFVVASYGKILPTTVLDMPKYGTVNLHPSLLPRLRGPSPIRSAILNDETEVGVSIMLLDHEMDHGPLIAQKKIQTPEWPLRGRALDALLAHEGAVLLAECLPLYVSGDIIPQPQNHDVATYCGFFAKEDGRIDVHEDAYKNLLKIRAFDGWPGTYTFFERKGVQVRVSIIEAHIDNKKLVLDVVKPEGKNEMTYSSFAQS